MEYFSINAFYLGMLLFACLFLSNVLYSLICLIWKIKIVEFGIFSNAWFALYNEQVLGTKFILGWLPLGSHIRPLGMIADEDEKKKINQSDLPFAFFNKPKYLKTVFSLVPWFIYILAFSIAMVLFSGLDNLISEFKIIFNYITNAFMTMFADDTSRNDFVKTTKAITTDKNIVIFGFILLSFVMLLFTPIMTIINWFSNDEKAKSKIQKAFAWIVTIGIFWLILWKIPKFVFSFFTTSQNLIYVLSFFIGVFAVGLLFFFSTLFIVKNISQNLSDNKLQ